jgi:protein-disulfide isomerase
MVAAALALAGCGAATREDAGAAQELAGAELLAQPGPLGDRAMGRADAPVTIVEYASLTCPHCRALHRDVLPKLKAAYIDTGKVRYVLREFPIGKTAGAAAIAVRCAPESQFFAMNDHFLASQKDWVSQDVRLDAIYAVAAKRGLSRASFDKCFANQTMIDGLAEVKQRGRKLGVIGTPTLFVNGEKLQGAIGYDEVKALIDKQSS